MQRELSFLYIKTVKTNTEAAQILLDHTHCSGLACMLQHLGSTKGAKSKLEICHIVLEDVYKPCLCFLYNQARRHSGLLV